MKLLSRARWFVVATALVGALTSASACTLLLATDEIIQPCQLDEDCVEGLSCQANACLPDDPAVEAEGEDAAE
jgi:hypothetical protein